MHNSFESPGLPDLSQQCVEVKLWEIYLLRDRNNLRDTLSAYSLEDGPFQNQVRDQGQVFYHFLRRDWEETLRSLLTTNLIPYEMVDTFQTKVFHKTVKKKRVYLVEDDLDILFALNVMLEDAGYDVLLSHCARRLMEGIIPPTDLFILDKSLHDGDGLEIYRNLRARTDSKETPVIMISAFHNVYPQAMAVGVNDFLRKPFEMNDFLTLVSKHTQ